MLLWNSLEAGGEKKADSSVNCQDEEKNRPRYGVKHPWAYLFHHLFDLLRIHSIPLLIQG
jgi:hypothetical protein